MEVPSNCFKIIIYLLDNVSGTSALFSHVHLFQTNNND